MLHKLIFLMCEVILHPFLLSLHQKTSKEMMNCNRNRQMVKRRIYSFQMDGESRAEAILRAFQQYTLVDWALYDRVSFQIVSSVKHPLLMGELSQFMSIGQSFKDYAQVELLQKIQAGDEQRLLLVILAYRDGNESTE